MILQTLCLRRGIVTLVALDLSLLCVFCLLPQMAFIRGCIVALIAFVSLFSTVRFQMILQTLCLRKGIVALVAFFLLFNRLFCTKVQYKIFLHFPSYIKIGRCPCIFPCFCSCPCPRPPPHPPSPCRRPCCKRFCNRNCHV